jgi:hypothetical protein
MFADYFGSIYSKADSTDTLESKDLYGKSLNNISIPMFEIFEKLKNLDTKKSTGPDGLPPLLFQRCSSSLTYPLFVIFNKSMETGTFPSIWKEAYIVPLHKSGPAHNVKNYRPISKLSIVSKVLESIVTDRLFEEFKNVIIPEQHGFFKKRSTLTNLLAYTEFLQRAIDKGHQVDVIYTDFSKAFDKVDHRALLKKLENSGIHGSLLDWISSYLSNRTQRIQIDGLLSSPIHVTSSVPQGSHLGPLLFSLFINDIKDHLKLNFSLYADDLKIFNKVESLSDAVDLQDDVESLSAYCAKNKLSLNIKKCSSLSFTRKTVNTVNFHYNIRGTTLQKVQEMKDLGVIYDSRLTFNSHINQLYSSCLRLLGFILRTSADFKTSNSVISIFNAIIRSKLEYASLIWSPHHQSQIDTMEKIQKKLVKALFYRKLIPNSPEVYNYQDCCNLLHIDTLEKRRTFNDIKFILNSFADNIDTESFIHYFNIHVPPRRTRSQQIFCESASRTDMGKHSVFNRIVSSFNSFVPDIDIFNICNFTSTLNVARKKFNEVFH